MAHICVSFLLFAKTFGLLPRRKSLLSVRARTKTPAAVSQDCLLAVGMLCTQAEYLKFSFSLVRACCISFVVVVFVPLFLSGDFYIAVLVDRHNDIAVVVRAIDRNTVCF